MMLGNCLNAVSGHAAVEVLAPVAYYNVDVKLAFGKGRER
jgi:hypothetical protein